MGGDIRSEKQGHFLKELKKRRRELLLVVPLSILFLILTWIELRLFGVSQSLPFVHSVFFFGLVNFNIIILLLLMFLIFRNLVKGFVENEKGFFGSTLNSKLVMAFAAFSIVPTLLMFLISVFYINNSFDKWFSEKMAGVLKSSLEVTNAYYLSAKKRNYHFADLIAHSIQNESKEGKVKRALEKAQQQFSLDAVEYYPGLFGKRLLVLSKDGAIPQVPQVNLEFLKKGVRQRVESSTIHHFENGNLVRVIVPVEGNARKGAVVVTTFIPLSLISKMNDIALAYEDFRDVNPLEYPLKSIYLIILIMMTMVILLGGTWFGFHLAKQLSIPLEELGKATRRIGERDYAVVDAVSGSAEINELISHFNSMTKNLERYENDAKVANDNLKSTLNQLDEHSRYMEVVLSNVSTGVISIDAEDQVAMINQHAAQLLNIQPEKY
ncbi:MAG: HAMP domain-containing protein, partial [Bdellovibrionales bacterium]|nr:HAMP domain-containing protein [Bdellovibrionales bacterium]